MPIATEKHVITSGLGRSQEGILDFLKRRGSGTVSTLADELDLNVETVRNHLKTLEGMGLVERRGSLRGGPGRPEILYALTDRAEPLFPQREGGLLRDLASFLDETGNDALLEAFFRHYIERRRGEAMARLEGLEGRERLAEVARFLTDEGFMAEIEETGDGPRLRLCHCPMRELVEASKVPCRMEIGFVRELMGEELARVSYIPSGDAACSYETGEGAG